MVTWGQWQELALCDMRWHSEVDRRIGCGGAVFWFHRIPRYRHYFAGHIKVMSPFPISTLSLNSQCQTTAACPTFFKPLLTSLPLPKTITVPVSCLTHIPWFWEEHLITVFLLWCLLMRPGLIPIWHQFYAATHLHLNLLSSLSRVTSSLEFYTKSELNLSWLQQPPQGV